PFVGPGSAPPTTGPAPTDVCAGPREPRSTTETALRRASALRSGWVNRTTMAKKAIVGEKVGMTQVWVDDRVVPVTMIRVARCRVVQVKTPEVDGYSALQVTIGQQKPQRLSGGERGPFDKAGVGPGG